jgi:hypothetical protein
MLKYYVIKAFEAVKLYLHAFLTVTVGTGAERRLQAKPSQSANWGRRRPSVCLAIPALTALLGSLTDTLTLTGEWAYANYMESGWRPRLRELKLVLNGTAFNGEKQFLDFGWLAVWGLNPDRLGRKFNFATGRKFNFANIRRFGEASTH